MGDSISVEEIRGIEDLRPYGEPLTSPNWEWALSLCGGRDRVYGPDTPVSIGSYIAVVPRERAQELEQRLEELRSELLGLAGPLDTQTGVFGRDPAVQVAEYARRCAKAAERLRDLAKGGDASSEDAAASHRPSSSESKDGLGA